MVLKISINTLKILTHKSFSTAQSVTGLTKVVYHNEKEHKGILELWLDKQDTKNAFSKKLSNQILSDVQEISNNKTCRCVIIGSKVKNVFCAGADLKERLTFSEEEVRNFVKSLRFLMTQIENIPVPVIAAMDGSAFGGGLELALACDIRVGASNIKMGLVETKLAIIPGAGGTQRLPKIVGIPLAKELIYTGRIISALEAKSINLINHITEQNSENNASYLKSIEIAKEIIQNGPIGVKMAKLAIEKGSNVEKTSGMIVEELCYDNVIHTRDRIEGLKSFVGKYKPDYKGE